MNLTIDQGNSSTKIGIFDNDKLVSTYIYDVLDTIELNKLFSKYSINASILSSVIKENNDIKSYFKNMNLNLIVLSNTTPIPIKNSYETPETLGNDRLAAVIGAVFLKPDNHILVIDIGTAITYDLIDSNKVFWGGNIAPGINLRLRSLHEFTQNLPLVEANVDYQLLGNNTNSAILSGVMNGIVFEIEGYIHSLNIKYPKLSIYLTGGSTFYVDTKLKSAIFAEKDLVLIGLNRILQYNVQK